MDRPLHAVVLPPSPACWTPWRTRSAAARDLPALPGLPEPALRGLLDALAPDAVETPDGLVRRAPGGHPPVDAAPRC